MSAAPSYVPRLEGLVSSSVLLFVELDVNDRLAAALAKLLSALGRVVSGVIVVLMRSHASVGVGLRLRSPSPFTGEASCRGGSVIALGDLRNDLPVMLFESKPLSDSSETPEGGVGSLIGALSGRLRESNNESPGKIRARVCSADSRKRANCSSSAREEVDRRIDLDVWPDLSADREF